MEIKIDKVDNKNDYFEEMYGVMLGVKKVIKNDKYKTQKISFIFGKYLIFILVYLGFLIFLIQSNIKNGRSNNLEFVCVGVAIFAIILVIWRIYLYIVSKKNFISREINTVIKFDEKEIEFNNKVLKRIYKMDWEDVCKIICYKECIMIIPKLQMLKRSVVMSIPMQYKNELIEILKRYGKIDLLRDHQ